MWQRASAGIVAEGIVLSTDIRDEEEGTERLIRLKSQAEQRTRAKTKNLVAKGTSATGTSVTDSLDMRRLRDLSRLNPDEGTIVNRGGTRSGVIFPSWLGTSGIRARERAAETGGSTPSGSFARPRSVLAPVSDREKLAFEAVQRALRLDPPQIRDLRARRGIGADAIDELRQQYEIKMASSPEFPNEVTLTRAEVDAAQNDREFFLAIVSGLADGDGQLRVRFIFDPLARLAVRIKGEVTLSGVREVEALEYKFFRMEETSRGASDMQPSRR